MLPFPHRARTLATMFRQAIASVVDGVPGSVGGLVMDADGISIDTYQAESAEMDVNSLGIEFGVALSAIRRAAESLETGETREVVIDTERVTTVIRTLGTNYFLAVAFRPNANIGKGRFLMRLAGPTLLAELA